MASTAAALQRLGFDVRGSDSRFYPPMSDLLRERGVRVFRGFDAANLRERPDLTVIGNAVSRGNPEVELVLERRWRYVSLPELIREFFLWEKRPVVVAGTHGKTTTSALLAWILEANGLRPGFLIGGLPRNFDEGVRFAEGEWFVLEGDEYDSAFFDKRSKFVHYLPDILILNNLEFDHADIFPDLAAVQWAFAQVIRIVPRNGLILANGDDPNLSPLLEHAPAPVRRYGFGPANDLRIEEAAFSAEGAGFRLGGTLFRSPLAGRFNALNAAAAIAAARQCGLNDAQIQAALSRFRGVRRRMEIRRTRRGPAVVDDFAHHPTAIRETLETLRLRFPKARLWALFEPGSNTTRRRIFQNELAAALRAADRILIGPVARADRIPPEERLDVEQLARDLNAAGAQAASLPDADRILELVTAEAGPGDVVVCLSNAAFDNLPARLVETFGAEEE